MDPHSKPEDTGEPLLEKILAEQMSLRRTIVDHFAAQESRLVERLVEALRPRKDEEYKANEQLLLSMEHVVKAPRSQQDVSETASDGNNDETYTCITSRSSSENHIETAASPPPPSYPNSDVVPAQRSASKTSDVVPAQRSGSQTSLVPVQKSASLSSAAERRGTHLGKHKEEATQLQMMMEQTMQEMYMDQSEVNMCIQENNLKGTSAWLVKFMHNRKVEGSVAGLIFLNAILIGVEADYSVQHATEPIPLVFRVFEIFFGLIFLLELLLRIFGEQMYFLSTKNLSLKWNIFDSAIVVLSIVQEIASNLSVATTNLSVIRLFRLLKIVRVFRIIRVLRFFRDLRLMVEGILSSIKSLMWAVLLLGLIMFVVAVCVLQFTAEEYEKRGNDGHGVLTHDEYDVLQENFGSMGGAVYTLWQSICNGLDWGHAAAPLARLNPMLGALYSIYIGFAVLCVLNIVTGVFVEHANQMLQMDESQQMTEAMTAKLEWIDEARTLFCKADVHKTGRLDYDAFTKHVVDPHVQNLLRRLGVDIDTVGPTGLFYLLDFNASGDIELDEFTLGLQQVHGDAKAIDIARVRHDLNILIEGLNYLTELVEQLILKESQGQQQVSNARTDWNENTSASTLAANRPQRRPSLCIPATASLKCQLATIDDDSPRTPTTQKSRTSLVNNFIVPQEVAD
jgi:hypothetical protein